MRTGPSKPRHEDEPVSLVMELIIVLLLAIIIAILTLAMLAGARSSFT